MANERDVLPGPLAGIRVIDLADRLGSYTARLLADLGADVIRVEPVGGSPVRSADPLAPTGDGRQVSLFDSFVNAGKRSVTLNLEATEGRALLDRLLESADVLVETFSYQAAESLGLTPAAVGSLNDRLVHVSVTPFGRERERPEIADMDLTLLAAGGLLHLGGYRDSGPVAAYGQQSTFAASIFAAVGALTGIVARETSGQGCWVDVSAQECIAQALEDSVAMFELTGHVRQRLGDEPREAGSGIYPCADGFVSMVAGRLGTARAWQQLTAWLVEEGADGADELQAEQWAEYSYRQTPHAISRFGEIFREFCSTRTREYIYGEAQRRGIALSPVNDIAAVLDDPQLAARRFFVSVDDPALGPVTYPGPPYRLSRTPARIGRPAPSAGQDGRDVLANEAGLSRGEIEALHEAGAL